MAERPYVSFAEVKEKISLLDVFQAFGIADRFKLIGSTWTGVCPLPDHKHGPSPNPEQFKANCKQGLSLWHCFGDCQRGGDVIEFVKAMTGYDNAHVRFWFVENFGDRLTAQKKGRPKRDDGPPKLAEGQTPKEKARALPGKETAQQADSEEPTTIISVSPPPLKPLRFHLNLEPEVPYLRQRGLTAETVQRYGVGLCRKGLLSGYVAIPVFRHPHEPAENPVGYLGRWPGDDYYQHGLEGTRPRYKFPPDFSRNRLVYGLTEALENTDGQPLIVVEGPFKVFHLFQAGFGNTVATFGASISDEQIEILVGTNRPLILLLDGDEAGYAGAKSAVDRIVARAFVRAIKLAPGLEPDHLDAVSLRLLLC